MTEVYTRIFEVLCSGLVGDCNDLRVAEEKSKKIVSRISQEIGGKTLYFPKTQPWISKTTRNTKLRGEFNGKNFVDLSDKYRLSVRQIRRIVNGR